MKAIPDCVPETLALILATAREVSDDEFIHRKVLLKVMAEIAEEGDLGGDPADFHLHCWEIACRALGVKDPYENAKARGDKTALAILGMLQQRWPGAGAERLENAVRASLAGAMLDFSGLGRDDLREEVAESFLASPALDHSADLLAAARKAKSVMLVADRAGEIALDRPLAEALLEMGKSVHLAVAAKPVFLMATERDAAAAGFPPAVTVVDPGTAMYGLAPERASSAFREALARADLVVVKGGAHFAAMAGKRDIFSILKAQDGETAERLGIAVNEGAVARIPVREPS